MLLSAEEWVEECTTHARRCFEESGLKERKCSVGGAKWPCSGASGSFCLTGVVADDEQGRVQETTPPDEFAKAHVAAVVRGLDSRHQFALRTFPLDSKGAFTISFALFDTSRGDNSDCRCIENARDKVRETKQAVEQALERAFGGLSQDIPYTGLKQYGMGLSALMFAQDPDKTTANAVATCRKEIEALGHDHKHVWAKWTVHEEDNDPDLVTVSLTLFWSH